jgi:hypothetical protein
MTLIFRIEDTVKILYPAFLDFIGRPVFHKASLRLQWKMGYAKIRVFTV